MTGLCIIVLFYFYKCWLMYLFAYLFIHFIKLYLMYDNLLPLV